MNTVSMMDENFNPNVLHENIVKKYNTHKIKNTTVNGQDDGDGCKEAALQPLAGKALFTPSVINAASDLGITAEQQVQPALDDDDIIIIEDDIVTSKNNDATKVLHDATKVPPDANILSTTKTNETQLISNSDGMITQSTASQIRYEKERKRRQAIKEARSIAECHYKNEQKEKAFKRLMHLVKRSKFYSSFLKTKINPKSTDDDDEDEDETHPSKKRIKLHNKDSDTKKFEDIVSPEVKNKMIKNINDSIAEEDVDSMSDTDNDDEMKITTENTYVKPELLDCELRDYQKVGLQWLIALNDNGMSGILADEMGLGKTVQSIALICYLMSQKVAGPYLIVAPLSTIPNWKMEFKKFAPNIPLVLLYGKEAERLKQFQSIKKTYKLPNGFATQPVVLTTYETPVFEKGRIVNIKWRYIIVDEGQRIKNSNCLLFKLLIKCTSMNRLLLTGTPLQNDISELWSLLNFLMPELFDDLDVFESWFDVKDLLDKNGTDKFLEQEKDKHIVGHLREILKPFMLRRLKVDVCPDIPPKKEVVIYAPMTGLQRELYTATLNRDLHVLFHTKKETLIIDDVNGVRPQRRCATRRNYARIHADPYAELYEAAAQKYRDAADNKKIQVEKTWAAHVQITDENYDYLSNINGHRGTMYKQIVNHPYMISCPTNDVGQRRVDEELIKASGKFIILDAMLKKLHAGGHKVLIYSTWIQILDHIEDYLEMRPWNWTRLDGNYNTDDRQYNIDLFNNNPNVFLFLITTRAGGVGLNLMGADTVIIFDSDWNPQADIQAMARCHRIGQTRPVMIYKLCTKGSYDELIINRANAKRKLEKLVISEDLNGVTFDKDMLMKMKQLLEKAEHEVVNSEKDVFSDEELEKLMDRSDLIKQMNQFKEWNATNNKIKIEKQQINNNHDDDCEIIDLTTEDVKFKNVVQKKKELVPMKELRVHLTRL